jgi:D-tyrosyl-tRNA(Tyr) deacylase
MRCVVQRVSSASVRVEERIVGEIGPGLLVFAGVAASDGAADIDYVAGKIVDLRVFSDADGRMNRSLRDVVGGVLLVSQFTLLGDARKGRRPAFDAAAAPDLARRCYDALIDRIRALGVKVETGVFQADMQVQSVNDGPVTILLDSRKLF